MKNAVVGLSICLFFINIIDAQENPCLNQMQNKTSEEFMIEKRPRVGVGVMVRKNGKVLLGKRKNAHGDGEWSFPGGHLEYGESLEECAIREVMEETGLEIENIKPASLTNDVFENQGKHYITIIMQADCVGGILENKEPHKCHEWDWFYLDELPEPLFLPIEHMKLQNYNFNM